MTAIDIKEPEEDLEPGGGYYMPVPTPDDYGMTIIK